MGKLAVTFTFLIFLLVILQPLYSASTSTADVNRLIIDTESLISNVNNQVASMRSLAGQISPCPDSTGADPCSNAQSTANSVLSTLAAKTATASVQLDTASKDLQNGVALSTVLNEVGTSLSTINDGIKFAITEADTIPSSCPDESGDDICPYARNAATQSLALVSRNYQSVKAEYDQLVGAVPQLTPEQLADKQKNDELLSLHPKLDEAKNLRETINNLEQTGASQANIEASKTRLKT